VETEELNKLKFIVLQHLTEELAEDMVNPPSVEVGQDLCFATTEIMVRAVFHVLGREIERVECRWPADWWQMFKERWFPAWAKARWPVKEEVRQLVARELYPRVKFPELEPDIALKVE